MASRLRNGEAVLQAEERWSHVKSGSTGRAWGRVALFFIYSLRARPPSVTSTLPALPVWIGSIFIIIQFQRSPIFNYGIFIWHESFSSVAELSNVWAFSSNILSFDFLRVLSEDRVYILPVLGNSLKLAKWPMMCPALINNPPCAGKASVFFGHCV